MTCMTEDRDFPSETWDSSVSELFVLPQTLTVVTAASESTSSIDRPSPPPSPVPTNHVRNSSDHSENDFEIVQDLVDHGKESPGQLTEVTLSTSPSHSLSEHSSVTRGP